jgi:pyrroloquinoline quinone biosynthesis protein D
LVPGAVFCRAQIQDKELFMSEVQTFQPEDCPKLNSKYLFRWEKSQDAHILLYPEGVIKLNASAAEILKRCTGEFTVVDITAQLTELFVGAPDIKGSINKFLEASHAKGWIEH